MSAACTLRICNVTMTRRLTGSVVQPQVPDGVAFSQEPDLRELGAAVGPHGGEGGHLGLEEIAVGGGDRRGRSPGRVAEAVGPVSSSSSALRAPDMT